MFLPERDRYSTSKRRLEAALRRCLVGVSPRDGLWTGVRHDGRLERHRQATEIARNMVTKWGLSDASRRRTPRTTAGVLGRSVTQHKQVGDKTRYAIDEEVRSVIDSNYNHAKSILERELDKLHRMAEALIKYETIDEHQIRDIMEGREPRPPQDWEDRDTPSQGNRPRERTDGEAPAGKPATQH
jgi:cell division protease FtsH